MVKLDELKSKGFSIGIDEKLKNRIFKKTEGQAIYTHDITVDHLIDILIAAGKLKEEDLIL